MLIIISHVTVAHPGFLIDVGFTYELIIGHFPSSIKRFFVFAINFPELILSSAFKIITINVFLGCYVLPIGFAVFACIQSNDDSILCNAMLTQVHQFYLHVPVLVLLINILWLLHFHRELEAET